MRYAAFAAILAMMVGCGVAVTPNPEPVDIKGTLSLDGKPISDVKINFQPTEIGLPAVVPVNEGKFEWKLTPGKYTWYITQGSSEKTLEGISVEFLEGSMARIIDVKAGQELNFSMD